MPDKATLEELLVQVRRIPEHREAEAEKKIRKMFKELSEDLNAFLGNEYAKYAEEDKLTHAILHQKGEYARFLEEVLNRVDGIAPEVHEEIQGLIENVYKVSYTGMVEAVEAKKNVEGLHRYFEPIKAITPETVKRAVKNPIPKLTLTKTLERNRKKIIAAIRREVTTGLTHGDRMSTMAGRIQKYVEGDYKKSILIARTEVHRVREAGFNDSANRIDNILKEHSNYRIVKIWRTAKDGAVRRPTKHNKADHTIMEGQTVLQDEQFTLSDGHKTDAPGQSGIASQDCNCRCYASRDLMSDEEFYKATGRHFSGKTVDKSGENDIMKSGSDSVAKEEQRYGRNKDTTINNSYIDGGEYRRKFDEITDNPDVNRTLYNKAKEMLKHRSGTLYEDMYWIDSNTGKVVASALNEQSENAVAYSKSVKQAIQGNKNLIAIHTHPHSMPPSIVDFNSAYSNGYHMGMVACHDGKVFCYTSGEKINERLYSMYVENFQKQGNNEYDAQIKALKKISENHMIDFKEV